MSEEKGMRLLMDVSEVAEALGVDYKTALGFIHSGALRSRRLDGRRKIQVLPRDLDAFIAASEVDPKVVPVSDLKPRKMTLNRQGQSAAKSQEKPWYQRYGHG